MCRGMHRGQTIPEDQLVAGRASPATGGHERVRSEDTGEWT